MKITHKVFAIIIIFLLCLALMAVLTLRIESRRRAFGRLNDQILTISNLVISASIHQRTFLERDVGHEQAQELLRRARVELMNVNRALLGGRNDELDRVGRDLRRYGAAFQRAIRDRGKLGESYRKLQETIGDLLGEARIRSKLVAATQPSGRSEYRIERAVVARVRS